MVGLPCRGTLAKKEILFYLWRPSDVSGICWYMKVLYKLFSKNKAVAVITKICQFTKHFSRPLYCMKGQYIWQVAHIERIVSWPRQVIDWKMANIVSGVTDIVKNPIHNTEIRYEHFFYSEEMFWLTMDFLDSLNFVMMVFLFHK